MPDTPLLQISDLSISFPSQRGYVEAVRRVNLSLHEGECLGLVGESGSGKTQLLLAILGLCASDAQVSGSICYRGQELLGARAASLNRVRGKHIGMVFQDPMTALNPYRRVGPQLLEVLHQHTNLRGHAAKLRAIELLESLHIHDAAHRLRQYPHELSGGLRQRVMIAIALIAKPEILLADEPSTALDVTVQAQILALLQELRAVHGTAIVLVTHDLAVVAELADRVAVMYAGQVMERAGVDELFAHAQHPYTEGLQQFIAGAEADRPARLPTIEGSPPDSTALPPGCAFAPRCRYRLAICESTSPALLERTLGHATACHYHGPLAKVRKDAA